MVHHYNGAKSAYSPAELVEIRKQLRRENAELRAGLKEAVERIRRYEEARNEINLYSHKLERQCDSIEQAARSVVEDAIAQTKHSKHYHVSMIYIDNLASILGGYKKEGK